MYEPSVSVVTPFEGLMSCFNEMENAHVLLAEHNAQASLLDLN